MKNKRSLRLCGVAVTAMALAVFAAALLSSPQDKGKKALTLSVELCPSSDLVKNCAAKVKSDNLKLAQFLTDFRLGVVAFNKEQETVQTKDRRAFNATDWWNGYIKSANPLAGTYLQTPKLATDKGAVLAAWEEILNKLAEIVGSRTSIETQSSHVCLEYLPYGSAEFKAYNKSGDDVDFIAHVKTVLSGVPGDNPVTMEGMLLHRKTCIWEPGD